VVLTPLCKWAFIKARASIVRESSIRQSSSEVG
jgi:hypothetical protein